MSNTISALLVSVIGFILSKTGIKYVPEDITTISTIIMQLGGIAWAWYERHKRGDITILGSKKHK